MMDPLQKHANSIRGYLAADAFNEAKNGTQLDIEGQLLALQERLRLSKQAKSTITRKLNDLPEHVRNNACHLYACGICKTVHQPVVRYDNSGNFRIQQTPSKCKGCGNGSDLPPQENISDSRWTLTKLFTVNGYSEYISKEIENVQIEIGKLEASKKKRVAPQMSKEDDNEEEVVPSKKMSPGDEVSVSIKFGQKLGLDIKLAKGLDEVVIDKVLEACTFKDRVGIGWRIISVNDVPVTSVKDLVVKLGDAPRQRDSVIKFAKPSARIGQAFIPPTCNPDPYTTTIMSSPNRSDKGKRTRYPSDDEAGQGRITQSNKTISAPANDEREGRAASFLLNNPTISVPQAMRRNDFTEIESKNRTLQQRVRRLHTKLSGKESIDISAPADINNDEDIKETAYHLLPIANHLLQLQSARAGEEENEDEDERDDEGEDEEEDDDDLPPYQKYAASLPWSSHNTFEAEEEEGEEEEDEEDDDEKDDNESLWRRQHRTQQLKQKRKVCAFKQALGQMHQNNGMVTSAANLEFLLSGNNRRSSYRAYHDTLPYERVLGTHDANILQKDKAAQYDMNLFRQRLRRGKVVVCSAPLHAPTQVTRKHLHRSSVTAADMNSSNPGKYLMAHAIHGRDRDAMAHIHIGGGLNHCHAAGMIFDINANPVTARPIQAVNSVMGGQKQFQLSNCCNWWNTRAATGIVDLYNNSGQLDEVPMEPYRSMSCYQSSHFNVQSVPSPGEVIFWLNGERYSLQVADPCADYGMVDSGLPYIRGLQNAAAIMPPNWLNSQFLQTRPHLFDAFCHPHYGNWFDGRRLENQHLVLGYGSAVGITVRTAYMYDAMRAYRWAFRNTVPLHQMAEHGQFHYSHICPFTCMYNAAYKEERKQYYLPHRVQGPMLEPWRTEEGFGQGTVLHLLHNRNVVQSLWTPMEATGIHHGYVKMRLPCPMHTSYHVVYGPWQHPFSSARYIRYFRYYRPDPCPKMFWFEFDAEDDL